MARVSRIKKSRVERRCHRGHVIPVGSAYSFAAPGYHGREIYACNDHPFRPSNLTTSERATALAAQESLSDTLDAIDAESTEALDELETALDEYRSELDDYLSNRESALDAWEYGNSQLEELRDVAQQAVDDAENVQIETWDGDEELRDADLEAHTLEEPVEPGADASPRRYAAFEDAYALWEERREAIEEAKTSWREHVEAQIDEVRALTESEV